MEGRGDSTCRVGKCNPVRSFHYYPVHYLLAVVDSEPRAEAAMMDLLAADIPGPELHTWFGPDGEAALDPRGVRHGTASRIWRMLQRASGEQATIEHYARELRLGRVCIGVHCHSDAQRTRAWSILERHGAHLVTYMSLGSVETLTP